MHSTLLLLVGFQLAPITALLAIVPIIFEASDPSQPRRRGDHFRDPAVQQRDDVFPPGWSSLGCYTDNPAQRTLTSREFSDPEMRVWICVEVCNALGHIYAGVENGEDCYCGNVLTIGATPAPPSDCNSTCSGNSSESCGGSDRLNLYWSGATPPQPTFVPNVGGWTYNGCFDDFINSRTLTVQASVKGGPYNNSVEGCVSACGLLGYRLAGVEFAQECWCDNVINWFSQRIATTHCMLACSGDSSEICGGADSLVMYFNRDARR